MSNGKWALGTGMSDPMVLPDKLSINIGEINFTKIFVKLISQKNVPTQVISVIRGVHNNSILQHFIIL